MSETKCAYCNEVAQAFLERWTEEYDGEIYAVTEYMLDTGEMELSTPISDAVEMVSAYISPPD